MNQRIQELLLEAQKSVQFLDNSEDAKQRIVMERFAELIVAECYGEVLCQLYDYNPSLNEQFNLGHETGLKLAASKIKQRFGVE